MKGLATLLEGCTGPCPIIPTNHLHHIPLRIRVLLSHHSHVVVELTRNFKNLLEVFSRQPDPLTGIGMEAG